jgi:hypothetical protein
MEPEYRATRSELIAAFRAWEDQARAENWPDEPDPQVKAERNADELIRRLQA